jgi:hypothetical protein
MDAKITKEYKIIVRFFKEIGLYKEFKDYNNEEDTVKFHVDATDAITEFGKTSISHWLRRTRGIIVIGGNLYDYFKAWLYAFYPDLYPYLVYYNTPSEYFLKRVDKKKKIIKIEYEYSKTNNAR